MGLVLPFLYLSAQETQPTKTEILKEINELVNEIKTLKNNNELSDEEKEQQEIALRKLALSKIMDLSLLEANELKIKLEGLELDSEELEAVQAQWLALLNKYTEYYEGFKERLTNEELSLTDLKNLAKEFKAWRKDNHYKKQISQILIFVLVFTEKSILKIADIRLEKIIANLDQLESAQLIEKQNFQPLLNAATLNLSNAHLLNETARTLLLSAAATSTAATSTVVADETTATTTQPTEKKNDIKALIIETLREIKTAYKNFLEISKQVKQRLGL